MGAGPDARGGVGRPGPAGLQPGGGPGTDYHDGVIDRFGRGFTVVVGAATALVLVALAIVPFLNPVWVGFEQQRSGALEATGYSASELAAATGAILGDLVFGPPDFDVEVGGEPVLTMRERGHMADVRGVFGGFAVAALVAAAALLVAWWTAGRRDGGRRAFWRAAGLGGRALAIGVVLVGGVALVAFDALFEVFHRLLFAGGSFTFDPTSERLVQLFPFQFWFDTAIAVGVVILLIALATAVLARRRAAAGAADARPATSAALEGAR